MSKLQRIGKQLTVYEECWQHHVWNSLKQKTHQMTAIATKQSNEISARVGCVSVSWLVCATGIFYRHDVGNWRFFSCVSFQRVWWWSSQSKGKGTKISQEATWHICKGNERGKPGHRTQVLEANSCKDVETKWMLLNARLHSRCCILTI